MIGRNFVTGDGTAIIKYRESRYNLPAERAYFDSSRRESLRIRMEQKENYYRKYFIAAFITIAVNELGVFILLVIICPHTD